MSAKIPPPVGCVRCGQHRDANVHIPARGYQGCHAYVPPGHEESPVHRAIACRASVDACIAAYGVEGTLLALCAHLLDGPERDNFAQRLGMSLERFLAIASEVDKEKYHA